MINQIYYQPIFFDAEWGLHHLVHRIVSAAYTGIVETVRHWWKVLEFILNPKGVKIENIFTGTGTGTAVSVACTPASVVNSALFVYIYSASNNAISSITYAGAAPNTTVYNSTSTGGASAFFIFNNPAASGNFVATIAASSTWRVVAWHCSGVNLTTPQYDYQTTGGTASTLTMNTAVGTILFSLPRPDSAYYTGISFTSGEAVVNVAGSPCAGYFTTPALPT
jgi:hypothetical protein